MWKKALLSLAVSSLSLTASIGAQHHVFSCSASPDGFKGPFFKAWVYAPLDEKGAIQSNGRVLLEKSWFNPDGNHAFAPDMIFRKDWIHSSFKREESSIRFYDMSGSSLSISLKKDAKQKAFSALLSHKGNRNVVRTFETEGEGVNMSCYPEKDFENKSIFSKLYRFK